MAIKKSALYSALWKMCDKLRGGMDASQYKDYVLVLLAVKYVTDKAKKDQKFSTWVKLPKNSSFDAIIALKGKPNIGEEINKIIEKFAEHIELKGAFQSTDFNDEARLGSHKDRVQRLSELVAIFEDERLDLSKQENSGSDILGDAYEYFMKQFATQSGKSKGQFYTPAEVSRLMAQLLDLRQTTSSHTVYDPTCGSGSLLLKAADETLHGITLYGQEKELATATLAKLNLIVHNQIGDAHNIRREDTLTRPLHLDDKGRLKKFDFIVANPPFSLKSWSDGLSPAQDLYQRFEWGIPPKKNGDYAFLLHIIASLKSARGQAAVILPHGVLFRGNAEATLRKRLIRERLIKGIIGLPPNLFYGTGIPACILIIDKKEAKTRQSIFMIQADQGFAKDGNKNRLRAQDIHKIVDAFRSQKSLPHYARKVPIEEISNSTNDFNLNIPRYIDPIPDEDLHDIQAHLKGGIPAHDLHALQPYWETLPPLRDTLWKPASSQGYYQLNIPFEQIYTTVSNHPATHTYLEKIDHTFQQWVHHVHPTLQKVNKKTPLKQLIHTIADAIHKTFTPIPLLDPYQVYQTLMDYWEETLQDDLYLITSQGWQADITPSTHKKKTVWTSELLPKDIVIRHLYPKKHQAIQALQTRLEENTEQQETMCSSQDAEEDPFSKVRNKQGKIHKKSLIERLNAIQQDPYLQEEYTLLDRYRKLLDKEEHLKQKIKQTEQSLDTELLQRYTTLTPQEVQDLLIHHKWLPTLHQAIRSQALQVIQNLCARIQILAARYQKPLSELTQEVQARTQKVEAHLAQMGFVC